MGRLVTIVSVLGFVISLTALGVALLAQPDASVVAHPTPFNNPAETSELRRQIQGLDEANRRLSERITALERSGLPQANTRGVPQPPGGDESLDSLNPSGARQLSGALDDESTRNAIKELVREVQDEQLKEFSAERTARFEQVEQSRTIKWQMFARAVRLSSGLETQLLKHLEEESRIRRSALESRGQGIHAADLSAARQRTDAFMRSQLDAAQLQEYEVMRKEDRRMWTGLSSAKK